MNEENVFEYITELVKLHGLKGSSFRRNERDTIYLANNKYECYIQIGYWKIDKDYNINPCISIDVNSEHERLSINKRYSTKEEFKKDFGKVISFINN